MTKAGLVFCGLVCAGLAFCCARSATAQDDLTQLIVELLKDPDKDIRSLAFEQIRNEAPGEAATRKFAELLPGLPADAQVGLLGALGDRGDRAAAPAVRNLLTSSKDEEIRIAAVKALGRLGQPDDLSVLVQLLLTGSQAEQDAARRSLIVLPGDGISAAMAKLMDDSPAAQRVALIEILAARHARNTIPSILKAAVHDDPLVRGAAMEALSKIVEPAHVAGMVQGVLKAERGRERDAAEKAVMLVCQRIEDPRQQAAPLLEAMDDLSSSDRKILLSTLGRVGGLDAREVVEAAVSSGDLHDDGIRALCNWPDASIAFRLLALARTEQHESHRRMALQALIRVAPLPDERSDQLRLDLLRTAMAMCSEDTDRRLVLDRAKAIRTTESLRFVLPYTDQDPYAEQACLTVVELAHHSSLREAHRAEFHAALDHVIQVSQDATVVDRAHRYQKGQTWVRPAGPVSR